MKQDSNSTHRRPDWILDESKFDQVSEEELQPFYNNGRNLRIEIAGTPEFRHQWCTIITAAGGLVVSRIGARENPTINFVVSDSAPTALYVEWSWVNKRLCSVEWVMQCLFQRRLIDVDECDAFWVEAEL